MAPRKSPNERKVNTYRPFSRITHHIDPMVLYTFLALLLISTALLAFQASTRENCADANISIAGRQHTGANVTFTVGEVITFRADAAAGGKNGFSWQFGDSTQEAPGQQVYHAFGKPGSYIVTLKAGKCSWRREVLIVSALPDNAPPPAADVYPVIEGPSEVFAGRQVTFTNNTPNATRWEWRLLQNGAETHYGSSVTYTFGSPGQRTLSLIVNGDTSRMVTKRIEVFPAPSENRNNNAFEPVPFPDQAPQPAPQPDQPAQPGKPGAPAVSDDEFKFMLAQVVDKKKNAGDFSPYLCNNLNARVLLNDKDTDTFEHFCSRIRGKRRFKIEMVNLIKDQNGCITEIRIRYDKKGFLGIF